MARKISLEIEAVNNAQKAVSAALKQVKALTKAVKQNQKAADKTTSKTREEIAARKKLAKAIRDQRIDKELAQLEKVTDGFSLCKLNTVSVHYRYKSTGRSFSVDKPCR